MNRRAWLGAVVLAGLGLITGGCTDRPATDVSTGEPVGNGVPSGATGSHSASIEFPREGTPGGVPLVNSGDFARKADRPDAFKPVGLGPGPWPMEAVRNYSTDFAVGTPQSVALDEGLNLWLLDGARIGVLRPGDAAPRWTTGIGQARAPFGDGAPAWGSTVICGGEPGRAYVGYRARELEKTVPGKSHGYIPGPGDPYYTDERWAEYQKGDLDAVRLGADGAVTLEEHVWRSVGTSNATTPLGIHNTNDYHYDEDRTVLACERVTRGRDRGDLYITTNHGVTRIKGLMYNSHRHPGWYLEVPLPDGTIDHQLQTPKMYGLGIAPNGDVLVANEQMAGVLIPSPNLIDWDREHTWEGPTPWRFKGYNSALNGQESDDFWRAFQQTTGGAYYLGSAQYGVWKMTLASRSTGNWTKLAGLPTNQINALRATDDGALYIGTDGGGLWRLEADGTTLARVTTVSGNKVIQLGYEPNVAPPMLLVLTENGLTVLRQ